MADDAEMRDADAADEERRQYAYGPLNEEDLDEKYPNRPHNHHKTLPFHDLYLTLFNPLSDNKKKPTGPVIARKKQGPHGPSNLSPHEIRRDIIDRFISRWRKEVGNDIYPALRLIVPEKDRDRPMYGLKEKTIGKLLIRVLKISKDSEDGFNLINWKLPGQRATAAMAGDFAGRCYDVISRRPIRTEPGSMTIGEVNELLDKLAITSKEEDQLPIFEHFYKHMNAEEMLWLIRIILRQMKVGATEKTIFDIWHPDAESLFNVSSSLRRVCWELYDPKIRLDGEDRGIALMQCFQPQLAAFQMHSFEKMVSRMKPTTDDDEFWIEEKLDGERMQLHMIEDDSTPGGKRFAFWSRKAKEYTYLYGSGFEDENSALTRHLKNAFSEGVRNLILDGEMITWDMEEDAMVPFGTLKTAALAEQRNPFSGKERPLYKVFDCLYLNDRPITNYTLRDRRRALHSAVKPQERRLEIHGYDTAHKAAEIEPLLHKVVAEASEGLVIKNPRSMYRLNERNDDWIKVKPEYMTEFGEDLDCVVIGGYYGSGGRGGGRSSFMCGLRVDEDPHSNANPMKFYSFFKVGGGFTRDDYRAIKHRTDGKWREWDAKAASKYIELGGKNGLAEKPDEWIRPDESIVISVKAASVIVTDQFRMNLSLRFPRFKRLRPDKDWKTALSIQEFIDLKNNAEKEQKQKAFQVDTSRKRSRISRTKAISVAGNDEKLKTLYAGPETKVFDGLTFFIMTESLKPEKKSKVELEQFVKANGGHIVQTETAVDHVICIADRKLVKVASMMKAGKHSIVRPSWLFDCIKQSQADIGRPTHLLPHEPQHMFSTIADDDDRINKNVDEFSDSYSRDVTLDELRDLLDQMPKREDKSDSRDLLQQLDDDELALDRSPGWMFHGLRVHFHKKRGAHVQGAGVNGGPVQVPLSDLKLNLAQQIFAFAAGDVSTDPGDAAVTHVVVDSPSQVKEVRRTIAHRPKVPHIVSSDWVTKSWKEKTLLDEERFHV